MRVLCKARPEYWTQIPKIAPFKFLTQHNKPVRILLLETDSCDSFEKRAVCFASVKFLPPYPLEILYRFFA
jgi:hypothetical protein